MTHPSDGASLPERLRGYVHMGNPSKCPDHLLEEAAQQLDEQAKALRELREAVVWAEEIEMLNIPSLDFDTKEEYGMAKLLNDCQAHLSPKEGTV